MNCSFYLKGMLIHNLEKGVRLIIKRDGPMKKFAVAKSNPPSLQLLVTAVHKTSGKKSSILKLFKTPCYFLIFSKNNSQPHS